MLFIADATFIGVALRSLFLASVGEPPFISGRLSEVATVAVLPSFGVGMASLVASTVWHRLRVNKVSAADWCRTLLHEV